MNKFYELPMIFDAKRKNDATSLAIMECVKTTISTYKSMATCDAQVVEPYTRTIRKQTIGTKHKQRLRLYNKFKAQRL